MKNPKKKHTLQAVPPAAQPQANQQNVVVLVVTPVEAEKIYVGLGKLPAETVEELRAKVRTQSERQRELVKSLYQQSSVQWLLAEEEPTGKPAEKIDAEFIEPIVK